MKTLAIMSWGTCKSPHSSHLLPAQTAAIMAICSHCYCNPCLVTLHDDALTGQLSVLDCSMSSSHKYNVLYWCFVRTKYSVLGRRNWVCIPLWVIEFICSICPSNDGRYTSHQNVEGGDDVDDGEAVEDDAANTLYEEIEEETSPKHVHFNDGEKFA